VVSCSTGVLPDGLQHPEARRTPLASTDLEQALVSELGEAAQHADVVARLEGAEHRDRRSRCEPAAEDRQAPERLPARLAQQRVAPRDRRAQRQLPRRPVTARLVQQLQRTVEPLEQAHGTQHRHPAGRELDRQRQPVEASADRGRRRQRVGGQGEPGVSRRHPVDEELERGRDLLGGLGLASPRRRHLQRTQREDVLAAHVQRDARRREDPYRRSRPDDVGDRRRGAGEVLEVVEHDEDRPRGHRVGERDDGARACPGSGVQCDEQALREAGGLDERSGVDEGDLVPATDAGGRHLEGESRLAGTSGSDDRHNPVLIEKPSHRGQVVAPPEEGVAHRG
jgi:hypothetical protein